jgi:hypothetical protein
MEDDALPIIAKERPLARKHWLLLVAGLAAACCWIGLRTHLRVRQARSQKQAVEDVQRLGGRVHYDCERAYWKGGDNSPPGPLSNVVCIDLNNSRVTDADLIPIIKATPELTYLYLDQTRITDLALEHLGGLDHLNCVTLRGTRVTDVGVKKLKIAYPHCEIVR